MIVKCGRIEYELTPADEIMFNGTCYLIITRSIRKGWYSSSVPMSKKLAEKLIKSGELVFKGIQKRHIEVKIYRPKG